MKIHFIIHESFEVPGIIEVWATNKGHQTSYTQVYQYEKYPESIEEIDMLIVMGGPQSPETTLDECPYFNAKEEIAFIKKVIDADKKVFGVCLGAQMIGEALGAKVDHSPNVEIGIFNVYLTEKANQSSFFNSLPVHFPVAHWHGDMPGLPEHSEVLAYSEGCPRQMIKFSSKVYGFQCHMEYTPEVIRNMIANCGEELERYQGLPYVQHAASISNADFGSMNRILMDFLDYFESI